MKNKKISIITGVAGTIGSNLAKSLIKKNHQLYGFYTLLRLIVSTTAGFIIYHSYKGAGGVNEISIIIYYTTFYQRSKVLFKSGGE